jgi:hypothetical protein
MPELRGILPGVKSPLGRYLLGLYLATSWRQGSSYEGSLISRAYADRRRVRFPPPRLRGEVDLPRQPRVEAYRQPSRMQAHRKEGADRIEPTRDLAGPS